MSENTETTTLPELPPVTEAFVERIKTNEAEAQYLIDNNITSRSVFSNPDNNHNYGVYEGLGSGDHVDEVYQKLIDDGDIDEDNLTLTDRNGNEIILYTPGQKGSGKELVVGHGHMLTGQDLAAYLKNEDIQVNGDPINAREYFDNLTATQAHELLNKDIKKHQRELNTHLESLDIDKNDMSKSQREALDEAMFQMGRTTFSEFTKFWTKVQEGNWAEAGLELLYGDNHQVPSGIWTQTPDRVRQYMEQLGVSKGRIDAAQEYEGEPWNSGSNFSEQLAATETSDLYTTEQVDETIPDIEETTSTVPETTETPEEIEELTETYTIKRGDILGRLASKFDTTVKKLMDLNTDKITNENQIKAGDTITVPVLPQSSNLQTQSSNSKDPLEPKEATTYYEAKTPEQKQRKENFFQELEEINPQWDTEAREQELKETSKSYDKIIEDVDDGYTNERYARLGMKEGPIAGLRDPFKDLEPTPAGAEEQTAFDTDISELTQIIPEETPVSVPATYYKERKGGAGVETRRQAALEEGELGPITDELGEELRQKQRLKGLKSQSYWSGFEHEKGKIETATDAFLINFIDAAMLGTTQIENEKLQKTLDKSRENFKTSSTLGNIAGGLSLGWVLPGSVMNFKGRLLPRLFKNAGVSGGIGAVEGYANSRGKTTEEVFKDITISAGLNAAGSAMFDVITSGWRSVRGAKKTSTPTKPTKAEEGAELEQAKKELKANIINSQDPVLEVAEQQVHLEKNFNRETLKSIISFTSGIEKNQLKFLAPSAEDAVKVVKNWEKTVDPKMFEKFSSEEILKIPQRVVKLAKKNKLKPESLHAYFNWRNNLINYVKYVNLVGARSGRTKESVLDSIEYVQKVNKESLKTQLQLFKKNLKAGVVNVNSYNEFKKQEYLAGAMHSIQEAKIAAAQIGKVLSGEVSPENSKLLLQVAKQKAKQIEKDPLAGSGVFRLSSTIYNAAEVVDKAANTKLTTIAGDLYTSAKEKSGWVLGVQDKYSEFEKFRSKFPKMTNEQIINDIEKGRENPVADKLVDLFKYLRQSANRISEERGLNLNIQEYAEGQSRYVPMNTKGAVELILGIEDKWKNITSSLDKNAINKILSNKRSKYKKGESKEEINLRWVQKFVEDVVDYQVLDYDLLKTAIKNLRDPKTTNKLLTKTVRYVHQRHGHLPSWARETNLHRLVTLYADQVGDILFKQPVLERLDTEIFNLNLKGFKNSADYFDTLRRDISGIPRKATQPKKAEGAYANFDLWFRQKPGGKLTLGLMDAFKGALYPNFLGLNPKAWARNLVQPFTMTARELGVGPKSDLLVMDSMAKVLKEGLGKAQKRYNKLGLVDVRDPKPQDFEGVKAGLSDYIKNSGISGKLARVVDKSINKYGEIVMAPYGRTDTINRLVTAQMSETMAKAIKTGRTDWVKNAPDAIKKEILEGLEKNASIDDLTITIGKWLQPKTQLNYSRDDMYEYGRTMGPMFAMLSKWPTAVTSDIAAKVMMDAKAGSVRAAFKYFGPFVVLSLMQRGADVAVPEESKQSKALFGYNGLPTWSPIYSATGALDAAIPISAETGVEIFGAGLQATNAIMSGRFDESEQRKLAKTVKGATTYFVPIVGGMMRQYKTFKDFMDAGQSKEIKPRNAFEKWKRTNQRKSKKGKSKNAFEKWLEKNK